MSKHITKITDTLRTLAKTPFMAPDVVAQLKEAANRLDLTDWKTDDPSKPGKYDVTCQNPDGKRWTSVCAFDKKDGWDELPVIAWKPRADTYGVVEGPDGEDKFAPADGGKPAESKASEPAPDAAAEPAAAEEGQTSS